MEENDSTALYARDQSAIASDHGVAFAGNQNVVVTGEVGNLTVNIGGRNVRGEELAYLLA